LVFGAGVVAASFLLAWAAEVAQVDIAASFATALLALIAVLPEYAVDLYFAFTAGHRPAYAAYAAANMTGSNRLLIGIGWPLVALLFAIAIRRRGGPARTIQLRPRRRVELAFLGVAGLYAFLIPLKRTLSIVDAGVLLALFFGYLWRTSRQEREEPELHGFPAAIADLPNAQRRAVVVGFFMSAAIIIVLAAKPFADALVEGGRHLGIDEFLLVQWLAPLASEAPELLVAGILALRGDEDTALGTLLSSKVNQWTLLVGSLPLAHALGGGGFALPLDARQTEEFLLTAAQAVFALSVLLHLRFRARDAVLLFATFALQLLSPQPNIRLAFAGGYALLALIMFFARRHELLPTLRALVFQPPTAKESTTSADVGRADEERAMYLRRRPRRSDRD
jgi:cation:H+ antiporter